jgi:tripartite-type tricarboxylate transporter receptor subunit TctC
MTSSRSLPHPRRRRRTAAAASVTALVLAVLGACGPIGGGSSAATDSGRDFYAGKIVQLIVPYDPGGGYDQWALVLAPYMQKYLGADKVHIVYMAGDGGMIGTTAIYNADPDGLTIGDTNAGGDVFNQIANPVGSDADMSKVDWLGRPDDDPHLIVTHAKGPYPTFDKLVASKGNGRVTALATGSGSSDYNAAVIVYNAFKVPFTMQAAFTGSSDEKAAFLAGQGTTASLSSSDAVEIRTSARNVLLVSSTPSDKLPHVPTVIQEAKTHKIAAKTVQALQALSDVMDLGHAFFAPPGVPADRLAALRSAFVKSMNDPGFQQAAKKAGLYFGPESDTFLSNSVTKALGEGPLFKDLLKTG